MRRLTNERLVRSLDYAFFLFFSFSGRFRHGFRREREMEREMEGGIERERLTNERARQVDDLPQVVGALPVAVEVRGDRA